MTPREAWQRVRRSLRRRFGDDAEWGEALRTANAGWTKAARERDAARAERDCLAAENAGLRDQVKRADDRHLAAVRHHHDVCDAVVRAAREGTPPPG